MNSLKFIYKRSTPALLRINRSKTSSFNILSSSRGYSANTDYSLRPSFEIALRAASIQLILARWGLETATKMDLASGKEQAQDERRLRAVEAIKNTALNGGLQDTLTAEELEMLKKDPGTWEYKDFMYGKHWESLGIFSWLLGRRNEIPPYFSSFDRVQLFQSTGIFPGDPKTIDSFVNSFMSIQTKFTIEDSILKKQIDFAEIWYWRARLQVLMDLKDDILSDIEKSAYENNSRSQEGEISDKRILQYLREKNIPASLRPVIKNINTILQSATKRGIELGLLLQKADKDFGVIAEIIDNANPSSTHEKSSAAKGTQSILMYGDLDTKDHDALMSIAEARMMAFAWATGKIENWSTDEMLKVGSINPLNVLWAPE